MARNETKEQAIERILGLHEKFDLFTDDFIHQATQGKHDSLGALLAAGGYSSIRELAAPEARQFVQEHCGFYKDFHHMCCGASANHIGSLGRLI